MAAGCVATASTTSLSCSSSSSSWSPSHRTRKLPDTPPSVWMVMPGRISSPSSKPSRSMSKCASPMPHALWVGFSRSWALIAIWKAWRFFAIFDVSTTAGRLPLHAGGNAIEHDVEPVLELRVAAEGLRELGAHRRQQRELVGRQLRGGRRRRAAALVAALALRGAEGDEAEDVEEDDAEGAGGLGAVEPGLDERREADLRARERARPNDRAAQPHLDEAAVTSQARAHRPRNRPQAVLPAALRRRQVVPGGRLVHDRVEQLLLGAEVAVQGHGPHLELGGEP